MLKKDDNILMWLLVGSEAIFFISLIMAYVFFWRSGHFETAFKALLNVKLTLVFTLTLMASSVTFFMAERSFKKGNNTHLTGWLIATIVLGIIFLAGQGHEYFGLLGRRVTPGSSEFGTSFYTLTGFHALHVIIGIAILIIVCLLAATRNLKSKTILSTVGIYWHFVDAVWLTVFAVIYLVPYL